MVFFFRRINRAFRLYISNNYQSPTNGMIGIGAGARSHTKELHYSSNYAVTRKATKAIIHAYSLKENFESIDYGFHLDKAEQINRFLIKSLILSGRLAKPVRGKPIPLRDNNCNERNLSREREIATDSLTGNTFIISN